MTQEVTIGSQGLAEELHRSKSLLEKSLLAAKNGRQPWNTEQFSALLEASAQFARLDNDCRDHVLPNLGIADLERLADQIESDLQAENFPCAVDGLIDGAVHYSHSGYLNQQLNFPVPGASIGALWGALLNQGQAVFSMSPITSVIEKRMLDWARQRLRLPTTSFGLSTGGGSLANLTALLAARNKLDKWQTWNQGGAGETLLVVSRHAHYSMSRAASILGMGADNVVAVDTDSYGRINQDRLDEFLATGRPCIVCLTAGTTSTGAFDDIRGFFSRHAELDRQRVWVHIDAAHGGSFYAVRKVNEQFDAFEKADSVCWDLHKVYFQSVPLSFLFFRDRETADYVSKHNTPYLTQEMDGAYPDMHNWTLECSRTANAMKLWLSLNTTGENAIVEQVLHLVRMTEEIYNGLSERNDIEIFAHPASNILCFRVKAANEEVAQQLSMELFKRINDTGYWSIGYVYLEGRFFIKVCCMNPRFTPEQVNEFVSEVERRVRTLAAVRMVNHGTGNDSLGNSEAVW